VLLTLTDRQKKRCLMQDKKKIQIWMALTADLDTSSSTISHTYKPHPQYHTHTSPNPNIIHIQAPPTISHTYTSHPQYHSHTSPTHNVIHIQAPPTILFTHKPHNIPPLSSSVWLLTNLVSCTTHPLHIMGLCNYSDTKSHFINRKVKTWNCW
jgi:hypothetical protein